MNPTMQPPPQQWNPVMRPEGMRVPVVRLQEMRPEDVLAEEAINPEEALRQLRMERARQHYERSFGMAHRGGQSLAAQGKQQDVDALLQRIDLARKMHNWRPGA